MSVALCSSATASRSSPRPRCRARSACAPQTGRSPASRPISADVRYRSMPLSSYRQFEPALAHAAESTERVMDRLLPRRYPDGGDADEARVFDAMRYSSLNGGKRLRAFFVLAGATLFRVGA